VAQSAPSATLGSCCRPLSRSCSFWSVSAFLAVQVGYGTPKTVGLLRCLEAIVQHVVYHHLGLLVFVCVRGPEFQGPPRGTACRVWGVSRVTRNGPLYLGQEIAVPVLLSLSFSCGLGCLFTAYMDQGPCSLHIRCIRLGA
jgi:hypothetical protein